MKKTLLLAVTLSTAIAIIAPPAFAKKPKATGDSGVEEALRLKAGDENGNELKALKTEMLVIRSEKRALAELQKLEKKHRGTRMEPEILFRLAELYMRRARSERFFEVHRNSERVVMFAPSLVGQASEAAEIKKSIALYSDIEKRFPRFRAIDVVIFNNAYANQQIGQTKEAEVLLTKLVKDHSGSLLVPDAYLALGEICFGRRAFTEALAHFRAIRRYPHARVYPYGLYKAAWTYYNLQDADSGLKQLEEVVTFGRAMALAKADAKLDLRKEALNDMSLFFSDVRPSKEAVKYFGDQAKELDAIPYIMRLVELYNRHSRFVDIEAVLKDILKVYPNTPSASAAHEELAWNYE
ncbi:MAG TPA: tetratricopeptide repeat protein, partial [Bdellovibrionales bacterium]|nr:tetratricopeptide repeat protein [Bdellovibrionales bacterium]